MIRTPIEDDSVSVRSLIKSVLSLWHDEWQSDALEHAFCDPDIFPFIWEKGEHS
jgi:hypothetical protein